MLQAILCFVVLALMIFLARFVMPKVMNKLTGSLPKEKIAELKANDALVLDVRSRHEYSYGKVAGSLNIPCEELPERTQELDRTRPILVCCASGVRSAKAIEVLQAAGFTMVYNGGCWMNVR